MSQPKIYSLKRKVRVKPEHPLYWEIQYGVLIIFLAASGDDDACTRSKAVFDSLSYEQIGNWEVLSEIIDEATIDAELRAGYNHAKQFGIGFFMGAAPVGADESWFEKLKEE